MSKTLPLLFLLLSVSAFAQTKTHTFTYGVTGSCACAPIQEWDGVVNGYAGDMGSVALNLLDWPDSGFVFPQAFGYPNNGLCSQGNPFVWGPLTWIGNGAPDIAGSIAYQAGTVTYTAAYNSCSGVSAQTTVYFVVRKHIGRFNKVYYTTDETNGTGSVSLEN